MTSIITVLVYKFFKGPAKGRLRVREFLATLKTHWWPSAVVCSMVGLLSLWHIPHFLSQFYHHRYQDFNFVFTKVACFVHKRLTSDGQIKKSSKGQIKYEVEEHWGQIFLTVLPNTAKVIYSWSRKALIFQIFNSFVKS